MEIDIDEFYKLAVHPDFPDDMQFRINSVNPDNKGTFSREGVEGIVDQMDAFIMARIMGQWKKEGLPPKEMTVTLNIEWKDTPADLPWYRWAATEGDNEMTQIDGKLRIPRSRHKKQND